MNHVAALAVGMLVISPLALAGGMTYTNVQQSLSGAVSVSTFDDVDDDSFSFAENSVTAVNQSFSIAASIVKSAPILMDGQLTSSFGADAFSIDVSAVTTIPNPDAFGGTFLSGSAQGDASAFVAFTLGAPTLVEYSIAGFTFAEFSRVDVFESIAFTMDPGAVTGQILLQPGDYAMSGGAPFEIDDSSGAFAGFGGSSAALSLQIIPAPGATALLAFGIGLGAARRRRMD